jgi:CheY-like chemotaxis protein
MSEPSDPRHPNAPPSAAEAPPVLRVAIFDDVVAARGEQFHIPGLVVDVFADADDAVATCAAVASDTGDLYDYVFMDFALGEAHKVGDIATGELRAAGFRGKIIAISSDPAANERMREAGADDGLAKKAHLRSYLVHLGAQHLGRGTP